MYDNLITFDNVVNSHLEIEMKDIQLHHLLVIL